MGLDVSSNSCIYVCVERVYLVCHACWHYVCVCVCVCVCVYTCIYVLIHIRNYTHKRNIVYVYTYKHACIHTYTSVRHVTLAASILLSILLRAVSFLWVFFCVCCSGETQSTTRHCHLVTVLVAGANSTDSNSSNSSAVVCDDEEEVDEPVRKKNPRCSSSILSTVGGGV